MQTVVISPKYQIAIPKSIRESMHLYAGEKVFMLPYDGRVELIPERSLKDMQGILAGMDTKIKRDEEDRI